MSSLTDYVRWYADLSFYDMPFNDVDNLVLSTLTYYHFDLLKKAEGKAASLRRCLQGNADSGFYKAVYDSRRFGTLLVSDFTEVFDSETDTQFAAMQFHLCDNVYYIAFRGTDNTLVGWREDFIMSYRRTYGQELALSYLNRVIRDEREYFVGGHSKGGHLALYAACHLDDEKLGKITHVYNNDGPGLCPEVDDVSLIGRIRNRTTVILPQYCIFGRIFAHDIPDVKIVSSSFKGIAQHDIISWGVDHGALDIVNDFDEASSWINDVAEQWIGDISPEEREKLVGAIFDTFEERGAEYYTQMFSEGIDDVEEVVKNVVESDAVITAAKLPGKVLFGDFFDRLFSGRLRRFLDADELVEGIILTLLGLLMVLVPRQTFWIVVAVLLGGTVAFQLWYTIKKLRQSRWNFAHERTRVYILLACATVFVVTLVKPQAVFIVGSAIIGGWLLLSAYKSLLKVKSGRKRDFLWFRNIVKAVLYMGCGVFIMAAPVETLKWFMLALGAVMVIDGICTVIATLLKANRKYSRHHSGNKQ